MSKAAPEIRQDMRYAGSANILGRPVAGYQAPVCILTERAAAALVSVNAALAAGGLGLVVFDCFRPERAVADLVAWSKSGGPPDPRWFPHTRRERLIAEGYVGTRSAHSRGSTVDVGLRALDEARNREPTCGAGHMLDLGTGFDCFDPLSRTQAEAISAHAKANRKRLLDAMGAAGFRNYPGEWWHFTLRGEPFPRKRFDFPVSAD